MKIGIFTSGTSIRLKNIFTNISRYPTGKYEIKTNIKAFTEEKLNLARMRVSLFEQIENSVGKGGNAGYQHFLLLSQCIEKSNLQVLLKTGFVW